MVSKSLRQYSEKVDFDDLLTARWDASIVYTSMHGVKDRLHSYTILSAHALFFVFISLHLSSLLLLFMVHVFAFKAGLSNTYS